MSSEIQERAFLPAAPADYPHQALKGDYFVFVCVNSCYKSRVPSRNLRLGDERPHELSYKLRYRYPI